MNDLSTKTYAHGHAHAQRAHRCITCLNSYRPHGATSLNCYNRDWDAQFDPTLQTAVDPNGYCTRWSMRRTSQPSLDIPIQLQLDF